MHSVAAQILEPGYGYVRISTFSETTPEDLKKAVLRLKRDNQGTIKGLVLDLRNNPGGVLESGVAVADAFLDSGVIVTADGRTPEARFEMDATPGDLLDGAPLVVLVNAGSASASEIVAGALKDHGRALLVGRRTYGKGSVQTVMPLSHGGAVKLTTSRYFTPSGASIHGRGLVPDITLEGPGGRARGPRRRRRLPCRPRCGRAPGPGGPAAAQPRRACPPQRARRWCPETERQRTSGALLYILAGMFSWLIDWVLHLDRHLVELHHARRPVDLPDPVRGDLLRDRPGGDAVPARGLAAVRPRGAELRSTPSGTLRTPVLIVLLAAAAVLGNMQLRHRPRHRPAGLQRALSLAQGGVPAAHRGFFERYGGFAVLLSRFMPIFRTLVALRRRHRPHALRALLRLQPDRRQRCGCCCSSAAATCSATSRW